MKCSVCIPTYHRPDNLNMVLASILAMNDTRIDEVIIAFTGTMEENINDTTRQLIKAFDIKGKPLLIKEGCTGICSAKQSFKELARNEVLLLCDDDAVFDRDYLNLLSWFAISKVGAVSGSLQTPINVVGYKDWSDEVITISNSVRECNTLKVDEETGAMDWSDKLQVYMIKTETGNGVLLSCQSLVLTS